MRTPGMVIWLTGLSGAGKSTLAEHLGSVLGTDQAVQVLDGDQVRPVLSGELGFSKADRDTNVGRIAYVADLLARHGVTVVVAAISPYRGARDAARARIEAAGSSFVEVFVAATMATVTARDPKGLYRRALAGELSNLTGISDPYESPVAPEVVVHTDRANVATCVATIVAALPRGPWPFPRGNRALGSIVIDTCASAALSVANERSGGEPARPGGAMDAKVAIRREGAVRRTVALFRSMASDFLLREQFITGPSQLLAEYVQGKRLAETRAEVLDQLIYSVMSHPQLLRWLRRYALERAKKLPTAPEFALDFSRAVAATGAYHVVLALARAAIAGDSIIEDVSTLSQSIVTLFGADPAKPDAAPLATTMSGDTATTPIMVDNGLAVAAADTGSSEPGVSDAGSETDQGRDLGRDNFVFQTVIALASYAVHLRQAGLLDVVDSRT